MNAREKWLKKRVENADYCHLGTWGASGHDNNDDKSFVWDVQSDLKELLADREALVRVARVLFFAAYWHISQVRDYYDEWGELSEELREEISDVK